MSDNPTKEEIEKEIPRKATLPEDEQLLLDTALQESDQLLVRSLHDDQRRRLAVKRKALGRKALFEVATSYHPIRYCAGTGA